MFTAEEMMMSKKSGNSVGILKGSIPGMVS